MRRIDSPRRQRIYYDGYLETLINLNFSPSNYDSFNEIWEKLTTILIMLNTPIVLSSSRGYNKV